MECNSKPSPDNSEEEEDCYSGALQRQVRKELKKRQKEIDCRKVAKKAKKHKYPSNFIPGAAPPELFLAPPVVAPPFALDGGYNSSVGGPGGSSPGGGLGGGPGGIGGPGGLLDKLGIGPLGGIGGPDAFAGIIPPACGPLGGGLNNDGGSGPNNNNSQPSNNRGTNPDNMKNVSMYSSILPNKPSKLKYVDFNFSTTLAYPYVADQLTPTSMITTGSCQCLGTIMQGSAMYNRIGETIVFQKLVVKGYLIPFFYADLMPQPIRMLIFYLRNVNGEYPMYGDYFKGVLPTGILAPCGAFNELIPSQQGNIVMLVDKFFFPNPAINSTAFITEVDSISCFFDIDLMNLNSTFSSSSNPPVVGDIQTGSLFLMFTSNSSDPLYAFAGNCRLFFKDL